MLIVKKDELTILPERKILSFADYAVLECNSKIISAAKEEAAKILNHAQNTAENIVENANREAERIIYEAHQTFESERKRGYSEGVESGKEDMAVQMMDLVTKSVTGFAKFEEDIVNVVIRAIRRIIGEIDRTDLITNVVKNALKVVKNQKHATLKVSNDDLKLVREHIDEIKQEFPSLEYIDVFADSHLHDGSCLLETEFGIVDASLEVQLDAIKKSLSKNLIKNHG